MIRHLARRLGRKAAAMRALTARLLLAALTLLPGQALAADPALICESAARDAAQRHGVPLDVMRAIALVETGRTRGGSLQPWAWAIHSEGQGHWLESRDAALAHVRQTLARGVRNIDLGCFQINYHWHGHEFQSIEAMIDPARNADYAARLLRGHHARLGSWTAAAGAYHSTTPEYATRYMARFAQILTKTRGGAPVVPAQITEPPIERENRYALLQPSGAGAMGSLVPSAVTSSATRLIYLDGGRP